MHTCSFGSCYPLSRIGNGRGESDQKPRSGDSAGHAGRKKEGREKESGKEGGIERRREREKGREGEEKQRDPGRKK